MNSLLNGCMFFLFAACLGASPLNAGTLTLRLGPPGAGNGGPNPLSIPPSAADMDFTYVTDSQFETNISVIPGILFGQRWLGPEGLYVSAGGGLVIDANGAGLGAYTGFGADLGSGPVRFNAEVKQAIAATSKHFISPYAFRLGATLFF